MRLQESLERNLFETARYIDRRTIRELIGQQVLEPIAGVDVA